MREETEADRHERIMAKVRHEMYEAEQAELVRQYGPKKTKPPGIDERPISPPPAKKVAKPVKAAEGWGAEFGKGLVEAVKGYVDPVFKELRKRIAEQDMQIKALEEGGIRYVGTWQRAQSYKRGDVATYDGSMWIALTSNADAPGKGDGWQLCVKRGRDGRQERQP